MAKTVTIYELFPPTGLSAAAVAGGALAASTTYYYKICAVEYIDAGLRCHNEFALSVPSAEISATTTAVNKSIQLNWTASAKQRPANFLAYILLRTTVAGDYSGNGHMVRIMSTDTAVATTSANAVTIVDAGAQSNTDFLIRKFGIPLVEMNGGTDGDRIDEEFIYQAYVAQGKATNLAFKTAFSGGDQGNQYYFRGCFRVGFTEACFWKINSGRSVTIEGRLNPIDSTGSDLIVGSPTSGNGATLGFMGINGDGGNLICGKFKLYNSKLIDLATAEGAQLGGGYYNGSASFNVLRGYVGSESVVKNCQLFIFGSNSQIGGDTTLDNCIVEMDPRIEGGYATMENIKIRGNRLYSYSESYVRTKGIDMASPVAELQFHGGAYDKFFDLIDFTAINDPLKAATGLNSTNTFYLRRWSFNITTVNTANSPISSVSVAVFDKDGRGSIFVYSGGKAQNATISATKIYTDVTTVGLISINDIILIGSERMLVTAKSGTELTVTRAYDGSRAHALSGINKIFIKKSAALTSGSGVMEEQYLTEETYQGKATGAPYCYDVVAYSPHTIAVRKYGFNFLLMNQYVEAPLKIKHFMQVNPFVVANEATAGAYTGITIEGTTKTIVISAAHALQEVYDYSQWWASQSANMSYEEPITTTNGTAFTLAADWDIIIDGILLDASGKQIQLTGVGEYSFPNGGSIEGVLADVTHTHVKITAPNLIDGTRVYLINDTLGLEVDNSVVSGGLGYVLIADIPTANLVSGNVIMLFATYCNGLTAKKELYTTGILTTAGLYFIDGQTDWTEYIQIGIDGSSVTEFIADYPNIEVDIDDVDNVTTKQRFIAWWIHNLTTADGIRFFFGGITTEDSVNYRINNGFNLYLDNLKPTPLTFSDLSRLYKANGGSIIATSSNSIQLDSGKVYSPKLDDMLTLDILNATTIPVDVKKINSVDVVGSGVGIDPWGGA
jgi:hypothetical protein